MQFKDLQKKKDAELQKLLAEERGKLYDLRLKTAVGQLKDFSQIKSVRKHIAHILTELSQRNQAADKEPVQEEKDSE